MDVLMPPELLAGEDDDDGGTEGEGSSCPRKEVINLVSVGGENKAAGGGRGSPQEKFRSARNVAVRKNDDNGTACDDDVDGDASSVHALVPDDGSLCVEEEEHHEDQESKKSDRTSNLSRERREKRKNSSSPPRGGDDENSLPKPICGILGDVASEKDLAPQLLNNNNGSTNKASTSVVHREGLDFDVNVPWQRSLLRELKKTSAEGAPEPNSGSARAQGVNNGRFSLGGYRQVYGVGHTDSRDFGVPVYELDSMTMTSDASSTIPVKSQAIHRPWIYPGDSAMSMEEEEHSTTSSKLKGADPAAEGAVLSSQFPHHHKKDVAASPSIRREQRDPRYSPEGGNKASPIRDAGATTATTAYARHQDAGHHASPWLEMEPSDLEDQHNDDCTVNTAAVMSSKAPADACFCNFLDLVMKTTSSPSVVASTVPSKYRRRTSAGSRRLLPRHAGGTLGRVEEGSYEDGNYGSSEAVAATAARAAEHHRHQQYHHHHDDVPGLDRKLSRDPDGAYNDEKYYIQA